MKSVFTKLFWISAIVIASFSLHTSSKKNTRNNLPGTCGMSVRGKTVVIVDKNGNDRILICLWRNGKYSWRNMGNFPSMEALGEHSSPAEDCSDIVRKRDVKSGFFWVKPFGMNEAKKVWCDVTTDGGGFMLVGHMDSPESWTVPSNDSIVSPQGPAHWSSAFGNVSMLEFRILVLTAKNLKAPKADWVYKFTAPRRLTELFISDSGGCTNNYPGIGHIQLVKDLLTGKVATENFKCSQFGYSYRSHLGWKLMNKCLGKPCKDGFAIVPGTQYQYDSFGAFSYTTNAKRSGVNQNSTAFIGCEYGKCCACFGPKGAKGDFCSPGCIKINGGTVTNTAQVWFWIRSSIPKQPAWKKCMEYEEQMADGKFQTHFIDEKTGVSQKGSCSNKGVPNFVDGVVKVDDKAAMDSLPKIQGLLSYRKDIAKLYVTDGQSWEALGKEKQDKELANKLSLEVRKIFDVAAELRKANIQLKNKVEVLEERLNKSIDNLKGSSCKEILSNNPEAVSKLYWINPQGGSFRGEFQVYCDMETHGGGWTLVYSYTFTDYNNFGYQSNAVTPYPNWPASSANVPISTSPPLSESSRGAVDYNLWKVIGEEIMIKSNINDWIVCQPNGGSMVRKQNGRLSCQNIKNVATKCQGVAPVRIDWYDYGPYLSASSLYYYFNGNTDVSWPKHDPCGHSQQNEKRGVANPGGAILLR